MGNEEWLGLQNLAGGSETCLASWVTILQSSLLKPTTGNKLKQIAKLQAEHLRLQNCPTLKTFLAGTKTGAPTWYPSQSGLAKGRSPTSCMYTVIPYHSLFSVLAMGTPLLFGTRSQISVWRLAQLVTAAHVAYRFQQRLLQLGYLLATFYWSQRLECMQHNFLLLPLLKVSPLLPTSDPAIGRVKELPLGLDYLPPQWECVWWRPFLPVSCTGDSLSIFHSTHSPGCCHQTHQSIWSFFCFYVNHLCSFLDKSLQCESLHTILLLPRE